MVHATGSAVRAHINEQGHVRCDRSIDNGLNDQLGWTAGGGLEYAFTNNPVGRVEYRSSDLGAFSCSPLVFAGFAENHRIIRERNQRRLVLQIRYWPMASN